MPSKKTETTEKKTTTKKTTAKKKEVEVNTNPMDMFNNPEVMQQMFMMFQQFQQMSGQMNNTPLTSVVEEKKTKAKASVDGKYTKAMLNDIEDEIITVRSVVNNVYYESAKTNTGYEWIEIGDTEQMSIKEILGMEKRSRIFLHTPWLIVEDDRVVEALGLTELYDIIGKIEDIETLLEMDSEDIRRLYKKLPHEYKKNFINNIYKKVANNEIRDMVLIKSLEDILNVDLRNY